MYDCKPIRWGEAIKRAERAVAMYRERRFPAARIQQAQDELDALNEKKARLGRKSRDYFKPDATA